MLKISTRNCVLKLSEIFLKELFLNIEKSRFVRPGPYTTLRPEVPDRLKHANDGSQAGGVLPKLAATGLPGLSGSNPYPRPGGAGSQFAFQNARFGAVGTAKHWVLR